MCVIMRILGGMFLLLTLLTLNLGCAQTQSIMKKDSSLVSQEEKTDFSIYPKGSGEQTDWQMYEEDQGGGGP